MKRNGNAHPGIISVLAAMLVSITGRLPERKTLIGYNGADTGRNHAVCGMKKQGSLLFETRELPRIIVTEK